MEHGCYTDFKEAKAVYDRVETIKSSRKRGGGGSSSSGGSGSSRKSKSSKSRKSNIQAEAVGDAGMSVMQSEGIGTMTMG
jgi:hypothetical protein